jgi:hypothetical protein
MEKVTIANSFARMNGLHISSPVERGIERVYRKPVKCRKSYPRREVRDVKNEDKKTRGRKVQRKV